MAVDDTQKHQLDLALVTMAAMIINLIIAAMAWVSLVFLGMAAIYCDALLKMNTFLPK